MWLSLRATAATPRARPVDAETRRPSRTKGAWSEDDGNPTRGSRATRCPPVGRVVPTDWWGNVGSYREIMLIAMAAGVGKWQMLNNSGVMRRKERCLVGGVVERQRWRLGWAESRFVRRRSLPPDAATGVPCRGQRIRWQPPRGRVWRAVARSARGVRPRGQSLANPLDAPCG